MFGRIVIVLLVAAFAVGAVVRAGHGAGRPAVYVVKPADTLWSIAQARYGGDPREGIWDIQQANDLGGAPLRPGQKLLLP
jgi:LysM repeat protein